MEDVQKIHIGGIKFSEELVQVTVVSTSPDNLLIYQLLQCIAEKNINIPFLCHSTVITAPESIFCVDRADFDKIQQVLNIPSLQTGLVKILPSVGTLTLYPHRNSLKVLGLIVGLFGRHGFPIYSFSTSISAIALNTDYPLLEEITEKLGSTFQLPNNHAPFRQTFRVTQIQP